MQIIRRIPIDVMGILVFCVIGLLFFYKTILFELLPVPSDSLVGLYHPWRDFFASEYPRGVPFKNFLTTDPVRQQIPWRHTVIQELKEGSLPLWSPYSFGGVPLAANIQSGAWNPFNILFLFFSFPTAWTILIIIQPVFAMIFMYFFLRHLKCSVLSSIFGSVVWGFSGFSIAWLTWGTIGHVALWLPVLLLLTDTIIHEKNLRKQIIWILLVAFSNYAQLAGGHAQTSLYIVGVAFIYGIWRLRDSCTKKSVMGLSASWLVSLLVTIPIWKPMLDLISASNRISQTNWLKEGWFFPWQHIAQFIAPDFFGNPTTMNYWGVWNYGEMIGYIGILGIVLAIGILFVKKTQDERFWLYTLGVVFVFMTPNPIGESVFRFHIPVLSSLQPTRLLVVVDFALSMLAAYGFMRLEKGERKPFIFGILVIGCSLVLLWAWSFWTRSAVTIRNLYLPTGLFVVIACLGTAITRFFKNKRFASAVFILFVGVTIFDTFRFGWKFTTFTPIRFFFPETETIKFLKAQKMPFRVLSVDDRLFAPNTLEYYGMESVSGYDPIYAKRYALFVDSLEQKKALVSVSAERMISPNIASGALLSLLNVKYVVSLDEIKDNRLSLVFEEGQTKVYENSIYSPRMYFAQGVVNVKTDDVALSYISNPAFSPMDETVVLNGDIQQQPPMSLDESITLTEYKYGNMSVDTDTIQERLLVVLNPKYPGWKASIDGYETRILSANYLFMGILVPKGKHSIRIEYH
jgi:uncharacterized membrane protein YfhO